jgi:hypothetical protein
MMKLRNERHGQCRACVTAVAACLAWRILPRGTINVAGTTRLTIGDGG